MPVERKPLFRAEILAPRAAAMPLDQVPGTARDVLRRWAEMLSAPQAGELKESELLPDFLSDVFYGVLGYRGPAGASGDSERYTLTREKRVEVDGHSADAVLGDFGAGRDQPLLALEGKGPNDPLDRPFAGRRMSAVDQGYRYAINLRCDWILVTNLRVRRLLSEQSWVETLVDLGHAKEVFEDADVFPSIAVLAKPQPDTPAPVPRVSVISRDEVRLDDLDRQVKEEGFDVPRERLGSAPWTLEPSDPVHRREVALMWQTAPPRMPVVPT